MSSPQLVLRRGGVRFRETQLGAEVDGELVAKASVLLELQRLLEQGSPFLFP